MATFVNFSTLTTDITSYIERGSSATTDQEVFNQIPRLVNAAERKLAQMLKLQGQIEVLASQTGLAQGVSVYQKPDRWRQTVSINYGSGSDLNQRIFLLPRSYSYCRTYWNDDSIVDPTQPPLYYADYGLTAWLVVPTPPQTYPWEVMVYCQPPLLDSVTQNNFWSEFAPNALLYGALLEAAPYLKNDERLPVWTQLWQQELASLSAQDLQKQLDQVGERTRA